MELHGFKTSQGCSCIVASLKDVLSYYGMNIDESDVYILGGGGNYILDNNIADKDGVHKMHCNVPNVVNKFLKNLNILYTKKKNIDDILEEKNIMNSLKHNEPTMIIVSTYLLDYDNEFLNLDKNIGHVITIIGVDYDKNRIKISDSYIPSLPPRNFCGWVNKEEILKAHAKQQNLSIKLDKESVTKSNNYITTDWISNKLKQCLIVLLQSLVYGKADVDNNIYYGIEAFKKYELELLKLKDYDDNKFSKCLFQHNVHLKIEGFIANRYYLLRTIKKVLKKQKSNKVKMISARMEKNIHDWTIFRFLMTKISVTSNKNKIPEMVKKYTNLYKEEIKIYKYVLDLIKL